MSENMEQLFRDFRETILKKLSEKDTRVADLVTQFFNKVNEKDEIIKTKDNRIAELMDRLMMLTAEKEERNAELTRLTNTIKDQQSRIAQLREQKKEAQDTVMGISFDRDLKQKELEEKIETLKKLEEKVAKVAGGSTGIIVDINSTIEYLKERITDANRSLRLVVPNLAFLERFKLIEMIEKLPDTCAVNIAAAFDLTNEGSFIEKWKNRHFNLTLYPERNLLGISVNGTDLLLSFISGDVVSGFYTNIADLVSLFTQAIMHPFMKGKKL